MCFIRDIRNELLEHVIELAEGPKSKTEWLLEMGKLKREWKVTKL